MKRLAIFLSFVAVMAAFCAANELVYNVEWHWGPVNVHAGDAYVAIECDGGDLQGTMTGTSIPIEGKVMSVADTIRASLSQERACIDYINGVYRKRPEDADVFEFRTIHGDGELDASPRTMEAVNITALLIGFFYYAETMDFASMSPGESVTVQIVNAGQEGELDITYNGQSETSRGEVYDLSLLYRIPGIPDNPIECRVDSLTRLPLLFASTLHIGKVQMVLR